LTAEDSQAMRDAGCDRVWRWIASIEVTAKGVQRVKRGGIVTGLEALPWEACVRVEPACTPLLSRDGGAAVWPLVVDAFANAPGAVGLQIDWDVPERLLPLYAAWLDGLRQR